MTEEFNVRVKVYDRQDPRLGRNLKHDSRSRRFAAPMSEEPSLLKSVRHPRFIPTLDQGNIGSCTGMTATACMGTGPFWESAGKSVLINLPAEDCRTYAEGVYSEATAIDDYQGTWQPDDTGSDGLSVAKVLLQRGLISGYTHAFNVNAVLTALASGPVMMGTEWRENMFEPDADGKLSIGGAVAGGHEYLLDELDMEGGRVWIHNSWGTGWGVEGRAYLSFLDLATLLQADGDCTVPVPVTLPAPEPTPVLDDPEALFVSQAQEWLALGHKRPANKRFAKDVKTYLEWLATSKPDSAG